MAKVICKDCGATAYSKCPYCRTVFPDNHGEAVLSHVLKWEHKENGRVDITFISYSDKETKREKVIDALDQLQKTIKAMDGDFYPTIEQYSCNHKWIFAPGEKSEIDCGCE